MKNIIVHRKETSLNLILIDSFHPSELNIKADHWHSVYKLLFLDNSYSFEGFFTGKFWHLDGDDIIVFEEYANNSFDSESIKLDSDIELRLFIIDFKRGRFAKFSRLTNGVFDNVEINTDGIILYQKKQIDKIGTFEVNLDSLKFESIPLNNNSKP